jgi:phenylpropionate dioxygenase-like ring-hydroxylating dioxygenase large terminal subunit
MPGKTSPKTVMTNKQWAAKYPEVGTGPVNAAICVDPAYFERERELIFRRNWINVGRVDDVPEKNSYFVRELAVCSTSILIMRGADDKIRAFHNVCAHRCNKLVWEEKGICKGTLLCGFHHWTFDTKGALTWLPDEENFHDFDKRDHGLTPVALDIWEGFLFINLDPKPKETLRDYLGGVADQLTGCGFENMKRLRTYKVDERTNWKVALDAQNEVYHLPFQHRYTLSDNFVMKDRRFMRFLNVNLYKRHTVWSCEYNPDHVATPLEAVLTRLDRSKNDARLTMMIGDFDFFVVFPNMVILLFKGIAGDFYMTYNFWPLAVDHTIWELRLHFPVADNATQRLMQEFFICMLRDTLREDANAHENIHRGIASRAKKNLIFQDEEIAIRYFHKTVEEHAGVLD